MSHIQPPMMPQTRSSKRFLGFSCGFFALLGLSVWPSACAPNAVCSQTNVSFSTCVKPLLIANCSGSGCHGAEGFQLLQLQKDTYESIVGGKDGIPSGQGFPLKQIEPGSPDKSYLYLKITQDKPKAGARMPLDRAPLWLEQSEAIRTWIAEGAKKN
ncbi:hypothetical protein L6R29_12725 [Myxococcota bacterium]|nr:hypothetical protein [Myxococcota bacterium]